MNKKKTLQVADTLHGSIQISKFEKQIISTHAFNRLHNILQNSTVYLTYPANQTKRFAHSLGVMHLGGEMFKHSIINAEDKIREDFLNKIIEEISTQIGDSSFNRFLRERLGDYLDDETITNFNEIIPEDHLFTSTVPTCIDRDKHFFAYCVMLQAVRCAALLHDIGHPPFSHITEFALKEIIDTINDKGQDKTQREIKFLEITEQYSSNKGKIDLHEKIGNRITDRLLDNLLRNDKDKISNNDDAKQHLFYLLVNQFTNYILEDKINADGTPSIFANVHRIVDGSIDCDRLDYVSRDTNSSSANKGKIEYDRLINSMKLMKDEDDSYVFCFDMRALSSIEDFFTRRWHLYKYIIFHHRVIKTDSILGKAIVKLSLDYLKDDEPDTYQRNKNTLPLDISGLWRAIKELFSDDSYFNALIQWDDSWLLTVLRQNYFSEYMTSSEHIKEQLEELLSNKRNYISVIKRMDDFYQLDNSIVKTIKENQNSLLELKSTIEKLQHPALKFIDKLIYQIEQYEAEKTLNYVPNEGFFLYNLQLLSKALTDYNIEDILKRVINEEIKNYSIKDSIVAFKKLKTGLEKSPFIHYNNKVITLNNVSNIEQEFNQNKSLFPIFFLYLCCEDNINIIKLRESIGDKIGKALIDFFQQLNDNLKED
ncbi:HD domain-containing protein [Metabacillus halosaccharovorans]|uniref:HD domain-containing protein n=1 Tax=Metabacillus halosaccharovorans TaxID=930124 RepID=UPI0034CDA74B